jgi:hypothetical protein
VTVPPAGADPPARPSPAAPPSVAAASIPPPTSITLAAATDAPAPTRAEPAAAAAPPRRSEAAVSGLLTRNAPLHQNLMALDPDRGHSPVAPVDATAIERGPGTAFGEEGGSTLFSESVSVPFGSVSSGSSLLAVLAGYVLPGVGGPPASTIVMFILVGLIVAIARAPRPQLSERAHDGALLGAARGHGLVVCRPG